MLGFALGGATLLVLVVEEHSVCVFANLTGAPCPGCGLTRATLALLRGEFAAATAMHPLIWLCLPLLGAVALESALSAVLRKPVALIAPACRALGVRPDWLWIGAALALLTVWLARLFGALGGPVSVNPLWSGLVTWPGSR